MLYLHGITWQGIEPELQNILNLEQGGELAGNLMNLYHYIGQRLRQSDDRVAAIVEVRKIIAPLAAAWSELSENAAHAPVSFERRVA